MKRYIYVIVSLFFFVGSSWAQRSISGTITDVDGEPLIGANVIVKGTTIGTATDFDGTYELSIPDDAETLVVSYTGYTTKEVTVGSSNTIDILLTEGLTLSEAVVTALGLEREEKSLGYGFTQVSSDEITEARNASPLSSLAGKVAGLQVSTNPQAGGSTEIVLRGYGSATGANTALIIVDGVPVNNGGNVSVTTFNNANDDFNRSQDFGNQGNDINPDDIESISVLKGAAATALYGNRAANGAILITTKSGSRNQKLAINYTGSFALSNVNRLPHLQNTYGQGWSGLFDPIENGSWGPKADGKERLWGNTVNNSRLLKPFNIIEDNLRDFYETGTNYTNSVSVTGGSENASFRMSYSNTQEDGVVPSDNDTYKRNTFSLKGDMGNETLNVGASIDYVNKRQQALATGQGDDAGGGKVIFQELIQIPRDHQIVDYRNYNDPFFNIDNFYTPYAQNPYFGLNEQGGEFEENRLRASTWVNLNITPELKLTARGGADVSGGNIFDFGNSARITPGSPNSTANDVVGRVTEAQINRRQLNTDVLLTYTKDLTSRINLDLSGGFNANERYSKFTSTYITDLTIPGFYNLSNTSQPPTSDNTISLRRLYGVFGIANFSFDNWLYASVTARNDWSSTLPKDNNSFFYPAVTLSAVLSDLLELDQATFSLIKLRASYAQAGNDAPTYRVNPVYTAGDARAGGFGSIGIPIGGINAFEVGDLLGNEKLQPEITTELEFGADIRLFRERVNIDVAYYNRKTTDQIIQVPLDPTTGFTNQTTNLGEVENKGIELLLGLVPVRTADFSWDLTFNYNKNENNVVSLGETDQTQLVLNSNFNIEMRAEVGKPLGAIYAPASAKTTDGSIIVNPSNGLPQAADDLEYRGSINPDFTMGFGTGLSYKNFRLSANADYRKGGVMYSYTARLNYFVGNAWNTQYNDREPFIIPGSVVDNGDGTYSENQTAIDRSNIFTYWGSNSPTHEQNHIIPRTFFKLREVVFTYEIPQEWSSKVHLNNTSISFFGRNLVIWTPEDNHFVDPEGSTFGTGLSSQMGEFSTIPTNASYGMSLKFGL
ncbi:MAG: SusC/RagA family TonB-linked outer membrane protein [Saprospiraceae bacterium]|nr:SusC/RagA family TonB-linked outer membrane protein [Saprospiraceae bacterium]